MTAVVKTLVIAVAGYIAIALLNTMVFGLMAAGGPLSGGWPGILRMIVPLGGGLVAGCLSALLFRRRWVLLALILSWVPIAFSWFGRGARTLTTGPIEIKPGQPLPPVSLLPTAHPDYSVLVINLLVAAVGSVAACWIVTRFSERGRVVPE